MLVTLYHPQTALVFNYSFIDVVSVVVVVLVPVLVV